uniref:Sulfhydryl oxidase n=1 Tax=Pithovirus LCPAC102 TaxID=2506587 RepID=A0A4D5XF51_9VIRU|nr:MAG: Erv1/Alr family disulfide (thiol) oxidoreductase [Pithovirus LCPAC102]
MENNWGKSFWQTMHIISYNFISEIDINSFIPLITSIISKMPCKKCIIEAKQYIFINNIKNITMKKINNKIITPFIWMCNFHNHVNIKLGKPTISWVLTYKKYNEIYESCNEGCIDKDSVINTVNNYNNINITFVSKKNPNTANKLNEKIKNKK